MGGAAAEVMELVARIRQLLAGRSVEVQGGVLAVLLAIWLAGHIVPDDRRETAKLREDLLRFHMRSVRKLVPVNAKEIHGDQ